MSTTPRTTPAQSDSSRIASAILGDREVIFAEHLRAGDVVHIDDQARMVEGVLADRIADVLVILYRPLADVRRAERVGLPICDLGIDEFYSRPGEPIVRRLRPGLRAA